MREFYIQPDKTTSNVPFDNIDGWWVEGDLADKIMELMPLFAFVTDESGNLIDVTEMERPEDEHAEVWPMMTIDDLVIEVARISAQLDNLVEKEKSGVDCGSV
ncbi:MAG: hypothetical protein FWE06_07985 [Oscillospiraceae bacterium]|nr:hypothetical protein [Oscillospiraceae bacterium]